MFFIRFDDHFSLSNLDHSNDLRRTIKRDLFSFTFISRLFILFIYFFQPERIDPRGDISRYDVRSDVWSFGISMIEISTGEFPYHSWKTPFEQLHQVVMEAPPKLPANQFTPDYEDFINRT